MGAVVLFDGVCNFCDGFVSAVIERDKTEYFMFAPLQSEAGARLAAEHGLSPVVNEEPKPDDLIPIDSIILVENGRAYTHSEAALRILKQLGWFSGLAEAALWIPAGIRDFFYRLFARYRYMFFGRKDQCMIPTPKVRARFLA